MQISPAIDRDLLTISLGDKALAIAGEICIYTNQNRTIEVL